MRLNILVLVLLLIIVILSFVYPALSEESDQDYKLGCCVDEQGFIHNKYPKELCSAKEGKFIVGDCEDMPTCKKRD